MQASTDTLLDSRVILPQAVEKIAVRPGATVRELIDEHIPIHLRPYIEVFNHGSRIIDVESVRVQDGDSLLFAVVPQGGGSGKQALSAVLMIVVAVFAWYAAPALAGALGVTSQIGINAIAAGITMVGGMLISALIKPPSIKSDSEKAGPGPNPFTGQSNQARPYQPIAKLYGRLKMFPTVAANPIIDNYGTTSIIKTLYDFGLGYVQVDGLLIGDVAASSYNPWNVLHQNTKTPELILVNHRAGYDSYSYELKQHQQFIVSTKDGATSAELSISFPMGLAGFNEKGQVLNRGHPINFAVSYREIGSPDWRSTGITPYCPVNVRVGMSSGDTVIPAVAREMKVLSGTIANAWSVAALGAHVPEPWNVSIMQLEDLQKIRNLQYFATAQNVVFAATNAPAEIYYTYATTVYDPMGQPLVVPARVYTYTNLANINDVDLFKNMFIATDLGVPYSPETIIPGPANLNVVGWMEKPFVCSVRFAFPRAGHYEIYIARVEPTSEDLRKAVDMSVVTMLKSVLPGGVLNLQKRHTMLEMYLVANEKLSGVVQNLSAICTSILPHYDVAGNLLGLYPSRNPAVICLDILLGEANERPLLPGQIDWASWKRLEDYCNEPRTRVVNGVSVTRPRHTCDILVDYLTTANELILSILSGCHASLIVTQSGKYGVFIDEEQTIPRQLITPANSYGFSGSRSFPNKPHALRVAYVDGDKTGGAGVANWQRGEAIVYADGYNASNAEIYEELNSFGITDYASAWAFGRYMLAQGIQRAETFSLTMDIEHLASQRGDLVYVAHDVPKIGGQPARVISVTGNVVKVSMPLSVVPTGYAVRLQNGSTRTGMVLAAVSEDEFRIDLATGINDGDLMVLGMMDRVVNPYLIQSIMPKANLEADLTLVKYVKEIYSADQVAIPDWKPDFGDDLITGTNLAIVGLSVVQRLYYIDRRPFAAFDLSWSVSGFAFDHSIVYVTLPNGRIEQIGETTDNNITWHVDLLAEPVKVGNVIFEVVPVSATGYKGRPGTVAATVLPDKTPPKPVSEFGVNVQDMTIAIFWTPPSEPDISTYELRYSPRVVGAVWNASQLIGQFAHDVTRTMVGAREGTYFIRVQDTSGNWSSEVFRRTTIEQLPNINLIETVNDALLGWPGTASGVTVVGDNVISAGDWGQVQAEGYYYFEQFVDLGDVYEVRVSSKLQSHGSSENDFMYMWTPLAIAAPLATAQSSLYNVSLEYRTSDAVVVMANWVPNLAAPIAAPIAGTAMGEWSEWRPIEVGDVTGRIIQFRVHFESISPYIKAVLDDGLVEIDVEDRIWRQSDIAVPVGGTQILFTPAFQEPPTLAITSENSQAISHQITAKSRAGFSIQLFDETGPVAGQIDVAALGYGRQRSNSI